jgi:hypothetical protein
MDDLLINLSGFNILRGRLEETETDRKRWRRSRVCRRRWWRRKPSQLGGSVFIWPILRGEPSKRASRRTSRRAQVAAIVAAVLMMKMQSMMAMLPGNDSSLSLLLLLLFTGYFKLSPPLALSQFLMRTQLNN